ncbi:Glycosyl transferase, family 9 [uncultured delta proteobacterium]|uniref:Glycosyl transferase, family 9 n=1 Tax=uncultured delta proteobacterium TaxID=34034 RepID=A0A212J825_9DELT|nr:Glycosyl transferase, family 9 [uncultured delta proteobacterium]
MHMLPKKWVVFRLSALGDIVLTTGVLRHWHEMYGWRFQVLTKEAFAPVFDNNPMVDGVITAEAANLAMPRMGAWFAELARRYKDYGLLDLHGTLRSALLAALWKGPVRRYAKHGFARRAFLLSGGRVYKETLRSLTVPQRYALAVAKTAPPAGELLPSLYLTDAERMRAKSFLANLFRDGVLKNTFDPLSRCVALHPFAAHAHKAWPGDRYKELVREFEKKGIPWVALGQGEALFPGDPRDLTGKTTLRESAALLAACSVLVSGDSGPMHLATAVGTPVIGLFGPTTREWGFFPSGPRDRVLESDMPCRPCSLHGRKQCPHGGECLGRIDAAAVLAALEEVWPETTAP